MSTKAKIEDLREKIQNFKNEIGLVQFSFGYKGLEQRIFVKMKFQDKLLTYSLPINAWIEGENLKDLAIKALLIGEFVDMKDIIK